MKSYFLIASMFFISRDLLSQIVSSTNYDELKTIEKKFIQKFSIDSVNTTKNYESANWRLQEINDTDVSKIFGLNDTTILFFYKPSCYGFDDFFKKLNGLSNNIKKQLFVIAESYYLGSIQNTFLEFNYNKQAYIIDKSFGKKFKTVKRNFCRSVFKNTKINFNNAILIWVDKNGAIIKIKDDFI